MLQKSMMSQYSPYINNLCSIFGILDIKSDAEALRPVALEMSKKLRHRGPDWSGIYASKRAILAHERLAIVDSDHLYVQTVRGHGFKFENR